MADVKKQIDQIEVKDLEDGSKLVATIMSCTELGNQGKPGLQVWWMGHIVNFEPVIAERWNYQAKKAGGGPLLLEDSSWLAHQDQFIKIYYVPGAPPKARVEVKSRTTDSPVVRDYDLPFSF
jgi:hypothetical protein